MKNYEEYIDKIINKLDKTLFGVLATSDKEGNVNATQMCIINDVLTLYFQTDNKFEKVKNITENNKVSINLGDYYFKGIAKIIGHPTVNTKFIEKIKAKHPKTYDSYTNLKDEILIEVTITECKIWGVDGTKSIHEQETIVIIDLVNKQIKSIACDKMN